jgi:hypothetical protein
MPFHQASINPGNLIGIIGINEINVKYYHLSILWEYYAFGVGKKEDKCRATHSK